MQQAEASFAGGATYWRIPPFVCIATEQGAQARWQLLSSARRHHPAQQHERCMPDQFTVP